MKFNPEIPVYGDQSYRNKKAPKESAEQITFVARVRREYPDSYGALIVHIKNEGKRTRGQAYHDNASGLTPGASDIVIPSGRTFVCEMKRKDHTLSAWQDGQQEYLLAAKAAGAFVCVALGHEGAWAALQDYINGVE